MFLNLQNGDFTMPPLRLTRHTTPAQLQAQFPRIATDALSTGWLWLTPPIVSYQGQDFYFNLGFHRQRLALIFFGMTARATSWDDWSETHERQTEALYHRFLSEQLGGQTQFSWGSFGAQYDPRSACSGMFVRYHQEQKAA
nr:hypothetical protein [uncultured Kingella sp.]